MAVSLATASRTKPAVEILRQDFKCYYIMLFFDLKKKKGFIFHKRNTWSALMRNVLFLSFCFSVMTLEIFFVGSCVFRQSIKPSVTISTGPRQRAVYKKELTAHLDLPSQSAEVPVFI